MVRPDEISWRLTVPAIWRDRARRLPRTAAEQAGFPVGERLELVIEPEAGRSIVGTTLLRSRIVAPGHRFVVVDAGSGTWISPPIGFRALSGIRNWPRSAARPAGSSEPVMSTPSSSARCCRPGWGSRSGSHESQADGAVRLKLLEEWERAKRDFDPQRIGPLNVGLPQPILKALYTTDEPVRARLSAAQNGVDGAIVLQPAEARGLFDHAIDSMVDLVRQHLSSVGPGPLPYLLLVGGFAESRYLQARFREALSP